jgi:hypothetical protein
VRRIRAPRPIALWHLASFDAPTVAVVWSLSFGWVAGARLPLWIPVLLALTVWAVYVGDRLLDAKRGLRNSDLDGLRERHYYQWRHRRLLLPMSIAAACAAAWLILVFMPVVLRAQNSILAAASLAYFARVHSGRGPRPFFRQLITKELLVGLLFTIGCALPALRILPALPRASVWPMLCPIAFFALLAWLNCAAIESWESRREDDGLSAARGLHGSNVIAEGLRSSRGSPCFAALFLTGIGGVLAVLSFSAYPRAATLLLAGGVSAALLACLDCQRSQLSPVALRAAADLALLTPAFFIPLTWIVR